MLSVLCLSLFKSSERERERGLLPSCEPNMRAFTPEECVCVCVCVCIRVCDYVRLTAGSQGSSLCSSTTLLVIPNKRQLKHHVLLP